MNLQRAGDVRHLGGGRALSGGVAGNDTPPKIRAPADGLQIRRIAPPRDILTQNSN